MNLKTSLVLAILFICLGTLAIFDPFKIKEHRQEKQEHEAAIFWLKEKKLSHLEITVGTTKINFNCNTAGGCPLNSQGNWSLVEPKEFADNNNVGTLLSALDNLSAVDRLSFKSEPPKLADFGLDKPALQFRFTVQDDPTEYWLHFGAKTAVGANVYAQSSNGGNDVLMVASYFTDGLNKELVHWRNKRFFPDLKTEAIESIAWDAGSDSFKFEQRDGIWEMQQPLKVHAHSQLLNGLAGSIAYLSATKIAAELKDGVEAKKLIAKPDLRLHFVVGKKAEDIEFFLKKEKAGNKLYARSSAEPWLAEVEAGLLDRFHKKVDDFRNKQLLATEDRNRIASVLFEFPRDKKSASFKRTEHNEWVQNGGDPIKLSTPRLDRVLDRLSSGEIQRFQVDKRKVDLLQQLQDVKLKLFDKDGKVLLNKDFLVANKKMVFTTSEQADEVCFLGDEFTRALPVRLVDLDIENNKQVVVEEHTAGKESGDGHSHSD